MKYQVFEMHADAKRSLLRELASELSDEIISGMVEEYTDRLRRDRAGYFIRIKGDEFQTPVIGDFEWGIEPGDILLLEIDDTDHRHDNPDLYGDE
ncbi:hypothetical protein [Caudoviricetes sp.]|nr:hypothetical protein [Caudoviricetes sp.]